MQTAFDFLPTLLSINGDQSKSKASKNEHGEEDNAHPKVRSKRNK